MSTVQDLRSVLLRIDRGSYGAYKQTRGLWSGDHVDVAIDHVQGDPFAAPSVVRLHVRDHGFDAAALRAGPGRVALCDLLLRRFAAATQRASRKGSGKSGVVEVDSGGATLLARSGCDVVGDAIELRFRVGLPANGRRVLGRVAAELLTETLPQMADAIRAKSVRSEDVDRWQRSAHEHAALTQQLDEAGLVGFVADGSILPRASGVNAKPLPNAIPMKAPAALRVELRDLQGRALPGLGIPRGVTLIAGAGFHGKSTLLQALAEGVYPHVPGDGREQVVTVPSAMKVRSEDGRSVTGVDLRPFISSLPGARDTGAFSTGDASGSTSLAAAIIESVELATRTLLFDEDTCATNLLVRDARMQALVERETIVPLIDRVQQLHTQLGVSSVLVVGGSGDYLDVADTVITMDAYLPRDGTARAREVCRALPSSRTSPPRQETWTPQIRVAKPSSLAPQRQGRGHARVRALGVRDLQYGDETICLDGLEQLVDASQVRLLGSLLEWLSTQPSATPIAELAVAAVARAREQGLYGIRASPELAAVRPAEVAAAISRLRRLALA